MNKSLLAIIAGIVVVGGLIGYTIMNTSDATHITNDGHTDVSPASHDDSGTTPHQD